MTNLAIHTENKSQKAPAPGNGNGNRWPMRSMLRDLLSWDPFREMEPFSLTEEAAFYARFEVLEDKDHYTFKADLPGVKESDLRISLTGNRLMVSGKRETSEEKKDATYYLCERSYGEFSRTFTLPEGAAADGARATLSDGVLTIMVPKKPGAQTKQIPISSGKTSA
ncbi:MAG: HSP20 family small heat-shock protein [Polyangia bacterium]